MFESDSVQIDNTSTDFSESEKRNIKNIRINELYDELMKENQLLRSQFEEAVNLTSQMEEMHKQNTALLNQVRDLKSERTDLLHRIEILVQKDKDNANKLEMEKQSSNSQRGCDLTSMNKEIEKIKLQSKEQIDAIYAQLDASEQAREKESVDKRLLMNKLDKVIGEASRFFETHLTTLDEVFEAFNGPKICISGTDNQSGLPVQVQIRNAIQQRDAENQKKVHRLKAKIADGEKLRESLEDEMKKNQREAQFAAQQAKSEIADLNSQIANLKEEIDINQAHYQASSQKYQSQIDQLRSEVSKLKEKVKSTKDENKALKKQIQLGLLHQGQCMQNQTSELNDSESSISLPRPIHPIRLDPQFEAQIEKLQQEVTELKVETEQANENKEAALSQLKDRDTEIHNLAIELEKSKTAFAALNTVHQESLHEIETLRTALYTREKAKDEIKNAPKAKHAHPQVVKLQKLLDEHKQKYYALQIVSGKQDTRIQDQEAEIRHLLAKIKELEEEVATARAETNEIKVSYEARQLPTADDFLPAAAFRCEDFSPELSAQIAKIANNNSLQPASKIQNSYKAIRKYYAKQLAMRDSAIDGAFNENQTISNSLNQFLVDASIALCDTPVTFKDFFTQNAGTAIVDKITAIRAENASLVHINDILKQSLIQFKETFIEIGDPTDPICHIQSVKARIEELNNDILIRNKKIKQYKSNLIAAQQQAKHREDELLNENQNLKFQIDDFIQQIKKCNDEIQSLKASNQKLTVELSEVNHEHDECESTIIAEHDDQIQQITEELNKQISRLKDQLRVQKDQFDHLEIEYNNIKEQLTKVNKQLQLIKTQKAKRDNEYEELVKTSTEKIETLQDRLESEKQNLTESYENALAKLHEQCEQHRSDVEKINAALSEEQVKVANLKATLAKVEKEKLKAVADMQTTKNQMKREKILMESTIRTNKLQAESQYNERLEEFKGKSEAEKRALLAFGADSFRDFFNPGATIDERSYKAVLEKAHEKLVQLTQSDAHVRRMVSASEQQTTEDAVAQLLLNTV